jgi:hypothetical protein
MSEFGTNRTSQAVWRCPLIGEDRKRAAQDRGEVTDPQRTSWR